MLDPCFINGFESPSGSYQFIIDQQVNLVGSDLNLTHCQLPPLMIMVV